MSWFPFLPFHSWLEILEIGLYHDDCHLNRVYFLTDLDPCHLEPKKSHWDPQASYCHGIKEEEDEERKNLV
jgi:hypothetical protein